MGFKKFQEIFAWQKAKMLTLFLYSQFKDCKDFRFRDQIQSASVSIMSNIAEGYGRHSQKEFRRFLDIAQRSAYEVESLLDLSIELKYLDQKDCQRAQELTYEITKMLRSLINSLKPD
jgi:four helix bundle protein